ncbi:stage VI sporulation protein D [Sutcliffiella rhizosphaerae]|uniref:LysM domain-containing protein n=1 Tax=Sutcliffiella rhizosphaerae TaxID=2880967 RepID=A0ABN8A859_9BACI|nr:stage VI sporulation protein D [Sutcliffiella rhizosphaerae]CAG9619522.1 hypothetical protein BACCIP111883_00289 [Sutcliffiella rhizosphaerae]
MSSEQQSCLRFSVEESIWFQKGQEVSELISIALDPDIQIYEQDQYVSIRGALVLTGEYQLNLGEDNEEEEYQPQARIVQEVEEREDGVCSLQHRFPVDITIPKNRIQSLDDIYVAIESFDYNIPERGCLHLDAELSISGIYGHQQSTHPWEVQEESYEIEANRDNEHEYEVEPNRDHEAEYEVVPNSDHDEVYGVVSNSDHGEVYEVEPNQDHEEVFENQYQNTDEQEYEPMYRSSQSDNEFEEDTYQYYTEDDKEEILNQHEIDESDPDDNYNDGNYVPFNVEARKTPEEEEAPYNPTDYLYQDNEDAYSSLYSLQSNQYQSEKRTGNHAVAEFEEEEYAEYQEERDENNLSLTKIFAEDDGQEFTKLKICIVQQGESMDHIAERYDVSIQQLIRVNRLSTDDHINEGQLLYIPVKASSKS